jgi:aminoglycoside phosphotransferase (APT) family kinase protein
MSTVGHPLADLSNLLGPFLQVRVREDRSGSGEASPFTHSGFAPGATPGLPTQEEVKATYWEVSLAHGPMPGVPMSSTDRERELRWAQAFNQFRGAAICQGIAARQAARQASSDKAWQYAQMMGPLAEFAWTIVRSVQEEITSSESKSRLDRGKL